MKILLSIYFTLIDEEDTDLFEQIYNQYELTLFCMSVSKLHNESLAEDAVSETFLSLAKNFQKVHNFSLSEIVAYTVIINRNVCYDILKDENKYHESIQFNEEIHNVKTDNEIEKLVTADMINKLPDYLKDTLMLRDYYGFSNVEISKLLKISVSGVKCRFQKIRELLNKELI